MEDSGPTASIIFFVALVSIELIFYGFGTALQQVNRSEFEDGRFEHSKKAKKIFAFLDKPYRFVNTLQLIVCFIHLVMGGYFLKMISDRIAGINTVAALVVAAFVLSYLMLTFGILIPKRIAMRYPKQWILLFTTPIYMITLFFLPLSGIIYMSSEAILRIFGFRQETSGSDVTEEEIISMVNEGHEQGVLLASEAEMITNIFEYGDKEAQDIMTPRSNIVAIDDDMLLKDAIHTMLEERNSRYPVYEESIDYISGIINLKDALRIHASDETMNLPLKDIEGLIRKAHFVPETRKIDSLFKTMQSMKIQMVIVVDEYGQTVGLVAMEDILEEIVGNILDEYDEDEEYIEECGDNEYVIEGMTPLEELEERFHIQFDEEEFDTLNGYLISKMEKIPEEGEEFEVMVDQYLFKVLHVENKMIQSVQVTKIEEDQDDRNQSENNDLV